jgi:O-antigen ligase
LLTCLFYPNNYQYIIDMLLSKLLPCVPFFILGLCMASDEKTYTMVSKFSCVAIVVNVLYFFYYIGSGRVLGGSHGEDYSMYMAYLLLPNILMTIDYAFRSKKAVPIVCAIIGVIYAFAMGTRGAIVVIFAFFIVSVWRNLKMRTIRKALLMSVLVLLAVCLVLSPVYRQLLVLLRNFLTDIGASTRVVDYLMSGEMVSQTTGRNLIYEDLLGKLSVRPFMGYGIYGEYPFGYNSGAHNIYLEVVFHFGYPVGILLLVSYLVVFFKALLASKGSPAQNWIVLFGCLVFVKGIYGGSYLDYTVFFLLGLCLSTIRKTNNRSRQLGGMTCEPSKQN